MPQEIKFEAVVDFLNLTEYENFRESNKYMFPIDATRRFRLHYDIVGLPPSDYIAIGVVFPDGQCVLWHPDSAAIESYGSIDGMKLHMEHVGVAVKDIESIDEVQEKQ